MRTDLDAARKNLQQWASKVLPQEPREFVEAIERFIEAVVASPQTDDWWQNDDGDRAQN